MDAKTVLKELNEVAERAFSLLDGADNNPDKPNLDLYRLAEGLHKLHQRIEQEQEKLKFAFHNIRWLIAKGKTSEETFFVPHYPHLMYQNRWDWSRNARIVTIKNAEKVVLECIKQDDQDRSLQQLLREVAEAKEAYAAYYQRSIYLESLTDSELETAICFIRETNVNPYRLMKVKDARKLKKDDCQGEMV
jgi:hypothetical protein